MELIEGEKKTPPANGSSPPQLIGFRFNLKYIGNSMLHRNFTLPMLEWVAKDIKRQTVRGAQVVNQRQFSIPSRDIVLELQANKLTGVSAKDHKHCLFVHPMHCVSKYAQLQHDPTCFAYLIRETKDAPTFCHVFQAKSAKRVHDIFSTIREIAATASAKTANQQAWSGGPASSATQLNRLTGADATGKMASARTEQELHSQGDDFENSYQFEVMFVKKVKLQCRRVPASFVDDALETLRSFELLKAHHESKASQLQKRGKHVISATVDERQEYDEGACQSPTDSDRRKSSSDTANPAPNNVQGQRIESRSCQPSPTKLSVNPDYSNDFSPYNTITSTDLNERIAAMPLVSNSVSLDHETRQKLARQVRETIMATAASLKKPDEQAATGEPAPDSISLGSSPNQRPDGLEQRRSSAIGGPMLFSSQCSHEPANQANNFDLFRRASSRQNIKNRTVLLLIGKDELCTISVDKHQLLFSKSFNSIVHCLQGSNNKDHFGLICRDSPKLNPNAESYAGLIFKCQSEKVVREIMGALKQVIYSSQHNYHGLNSPYNPMNLSKIKQTSSESLVNKRGFLASQLDLKQAAESGLSAPGQLESATAPVLATQAPRSEAKVQQHQQHAKNLIKSMFCDNCPLYWFHRLCCDVESLPAEASKAIILRRIDSSLSDKEQDEIYSRFSEFRIESIEEHNEIFMSLLRHLCERQQSKHSQLGAHLAALAKNNPSSPSAAFSSMLSSSGLASSSAVKAAGMMARQASLQSLSLNRDAKLLTNDHLEAPKQQQFQRQHQRSGSSSGSLATMIGDQANAMADASSAAFDNLKKAKNSISVSIENLLKRRPSGSRADDDEATTSGQLPSRSGSFRLRPSKQDETCRQDGGDQLKRSQSTSDYPKEQQQQQQQYHSWKDSLSKTINDDLANPLVNLFRRRSSTFGSRADSDQLHATDQQTVNRGLSIDCLASKQSATPRLQPASPVALTGSANLNKSSTATAQQGGASPSSMLSSMFWKKSIFDKIHRPDVDEEPQEQPRAIKRTSAELRQLWRKAILEQITLLKMDKQNQKLQTLAKQESNQQQCIKLNYRDFTFGSRELLSRWQQLLGQDPRVKVDFGEVTRLLRTGVPKQRRGEIWMFLMNQYQLRHGTSFQPTDSEYTGDANQSYRDLLAHLSVQQHEIFVDIGRTFPNHPYYRQYLSIGQLSLFNLLKAYSLLDPKVGYCQGLSFVAAILLLHVDGEDEAFELMRHLLFNFGLRRQYLPSMNALHLQLYQITRLLRDFELQLFEHFDQHDISPSLYAAPWFLTLFANQFPLAFVARLLDLIFLIGIEAIFRVSLNLLAFHRSSILECQSLEATMEYMRGDSLVNRIDDKNLIKLFDQSMSMDLRNKLIEYEIEYTFYYAEDKAKTGQPRQQPTVGGEHLSAPAEQRESSTSKVADVTADLIIQHLMANNHLKTLRSNQQHQQQQQQQQQRQQQ